MALSFLSRGLLPLGRSTFCAAAWVVFALGVSQLNGQSTNTAPNPSATSYPPADSVHPPVMSDDSGVSSPTNAPPNMADLRSVPAAVQASHPELALVSPIAANARDPHAIDLQTCFQLTAVRDDSLKISLQDIRIAQAQLSQSIAALWPTFTATNQQQFIHYLGPSTGLSFTSFGSPVAGLGGQVPARVRGQARAEPGRGPARRSRRRRGIGIMNPNPR